MNDTERQVRELLARGVRGRRSIGRALGLTANRIAHYLRKLHPTGYISSGLRESVGYLYARGLSQSEISRELKISPSATNKAVSIISRARQQRLADESVMETEEVRREEERRALWRQCAGRRTRILVLADPHFPFHYPPAVKAAVAAAGTADVTLLAGDVLECFSFSRFRKSRILTLQQEVDAAQRALSELHRRCANRWVLEGNHEERFEKHALEVVQPVAAQLGEQGRILLDVRASLARIADQWAPGINYHAGWWLRVGNAIICHPDRYSALRLSSARAVLRYFNERGERGVGGLFMGHQHRMVPPSLVEGAWLCEMPGACRRLAYMNNSKAYGGPLHVGYTVVTVGKNGDVIPNYPNTYCHFEAAL